MKFHCMSYGIKSDILKPNDMCCTAKTIDIILYQDDFKKMIDQNAYNICPKCKLIYKAINKLKEVKNG